MKRRHARENPTPIRVEYDALMASIGRRYGNDPKKAIAINPAAYKEIIGEPMLARTDTMAFPDLGSRIDDDTFWDINAWTFGFGECQTSIEDSVNPVFEQSGVVTLYANPMARVQENMLLVTAADAQKLGRLAARVLKLRFEAEGNINSGISPELYQFVEATGLLRLNREEDWPGPIGEVLRGVDAADEEGPEGLLDAVAFLTTGTAAEAEDRVWVPWTWPKRMCWTLTTTLNRLEKAQRQKAKLAGISYDADLASGHMVYDWPGDPVGERWWVYDIPTAEELKVDGTVMGHCTKNDDYGHQSELTRGACHFFSLRREVGGAGERLVTMKVETEKQHYRKYAQHIGHGLLGVVLEARAKNNDIPGFPQFHDIGDVLEGQVPKMSADGVETCDRVFQFLVDYQFMPAQELLAALQVMTKRAKRGLPDSRRAVFEVMQNYVYGQVSGVSKRPDRWPSGERPGRRRNPDSNDVADMLRELLSVPAFTQT